MDAVQLFGYTIAAFGFAVIIGHAEVTLPIRRGLAALTAIRVLSIPAVVLLKLIQCPMCIGAWTGAVTSYVLRGDWLDVIGAGCYVAGANFVLGRLTGLIAGEPT